MLCMKTEIWYKKKSWQRMGINADLRYSTLSFIHNPFTLQNSFPSRQNLYVFDLSNDWYGPKWRKARYHHIFVVNFCFVCSFCSEPYKAAQLFVEATEGLSTGEPFLIQKLLQVREETAIPMMEVNYYLKASTFLHLRKYVEMVIHHPNTPIFNFINHSTLIIYL